MKMFLYGLSMEEESNIQRIYGDKFTVEDKTSAFTDVLAVPTDAVITNPDSLTKREKHAFSALFSYDHDTVVILNKDVWETEQFPMCIYCLVENLATTEEIGLLEEKLTEQERFCEAEERMEKVLERSRMLMMSDPNEEYGMRSTIDYINYQCKEYELLCSKLEYLNEIDLKGKVDCRRRLYGMISNFR